MKIWLMVAIVAMLVIAVFVVANAVPSSADSKTEEQPTGPSCGNSCTQSNNCGRASCGAVAGKACGCGS